MAEKRLSSLVINELSSLMAFALCVIASEDMFLYEQLPNFTPNVPALEEMFRSVKAVPGVETLQTSHITMAPVVKDPSIIERLTPLLVPFSHVRHRDSTDSERRCVDPIIGLETGRMEKEARQRMESFQQLIQASPPEAKAGA